MAKHPVATTALIATAAVGGSIAVSVNYERVAVRMEAAMERHSGNPKNITAQTLELAMDSERQGDYAKAGLAFAKLGLIDRAMQMHEKCPTSEGKKSIIEAIEAYQDAQSKSR